MRIIIDTGVLWKPSIIEELAESGHELVVPALAFAERARQVAKHGRDARTLQFLLHTAGIHVEALDADAASRYTTQLVDDEQWKSLGADALIAGHVGDEDVLRTTNPADFLALGLNSEQVHAVKDI